MNDQDKTKEKLIEELRELKKENNSLKVSFDKNIADLIAAKEKAENSGELFRSTFEQAAVGIAHVGLDGRFLRINRRFCDIVGYSHSEILLLTFQDITHIDFIDEDLSNVEKLTTNQIQTYNIEKQYIRKDKSLVWVKLTVSVVRDPLGRPEYFISVIQDINQRKQAETQLKQSEEKFRAFFKAIPVPTYTWRQEGDDFVLVDYNDKALPFTHGTIEKLVGIELSQMYKDIPQILGDMKQCLLEKSVIERDMDYSFKYRDINSYLHVKYAFVPPDFVMVHTEDYTEKVQAEQAKMETENRYRKMIENAPFGMHFYRLENNQLIFVGANPAANTILGVDNSQFIGKTIEEAFPPLIQTEVPERYRDAANGIPWSTEQITYDDKIIIGAFEVRAYQTSPGNMVAIFADITKRKQIANELIIAKEHAEESELRFKSLFHNMNSSASLYEVIKNEQGIPCDYRFLDINAFYEKSLGFKASYLIGKTLLEVFPATEQLWLDTFKEVVLTTNPTTIESYSREVDMYFELIVYVPQKGKMAMIGSNVTDRKRNELELIKAKEHAEESDRLKSAFLANMSHEIRTPMNGILGFAQLLKEPDLTGEQQNNYLSIIEKSGVRMLSIINDIIDISKIESGQMKVAISETNVNKLIEFIFNFFKLEVEQKGLNIYMKNIDPERKTIIKTDSEKLYAILTNLVKNSIKFTHFGLIEIGFEKKENFIEFLVSDTGVGISSEKKDIIFERFRQGSVSYTRNYQGSGLGLAISKAYVEMLGGKIWVESVEGKGSTFYFTLPGDSI